MQVSPSPPKRPEQTPNEVTSKTRLFILWEIIDVRIVGLWGFSPGYLPTHPMCPIRLWGHRKLLLERF